MCLVYSDSDIYLFDDVLLVVDVYVGCYFFYNCIKKFLNGKIIIFIMY